ncbi:hypothetical protein D5086_011285 [Populus alba]|uniref:Uncharacterized protein n=1 Tax=Populus alba TaxID=43335 RepID=A0ACC4CCZ4_POPAL
MESSRQEIGAGFVLFVIFSACLSDVKARESPEFPKKKKQDDYATGTSGHSVDMGQQQDFSCPMLNAASSSNNSSKVQCFCNLTFLKDVKTLMRAMSLVLAQSPRFAEMRLAAGVAIDMCSENLQLQWASQVWPSVSNPSNETWFYLSCETNGT